ncbi:MAG TPA: hypothetical protein EYP21_03730 [Syntrophaceae bacterium]|nr:hypothetical protein [Syntrophaceae bacterium]
MVEVSSKITQEIPGGTFFIKQEGLTVLILKGNPSELGQQHGASLKGEIHLIHSKFSKYLSGLKRGVRGKILYWILFFLARRMSRYIPEVLKAEMIAVAKEAKVPYRFILLLNVLDDLLNTLACSSFAVTGKKAKGGLTICGRNLDYAIFTDIMPCLNTVFVYEPKQGYSFISVAWPGYVGCVTGMNSKGLALSGHASNTFDKTRKGIATGILYRQALQYATSLKDIEETIASGPRTIGNNVLVASHDECFILELSANRWQSRPTEGGIITVTNHYQTSHMLSVQAPFIRKPPGSPLPHNCFTKDHSAFRDQQLRDLCKKSPLGVDEVIEALRNEGIANPGTVQSVVFLPAQKTLWVAQRLEVPVSLGNFVKLEGLL